MRHAPRDEAPSPFVPTLARARAQDVPLPAGDPIEQDRWAALIVLTTFLRRTSWREETHGRAESVAHLGRGTPPAPAGFERGSWVVVDDILPGPLCPDCHHTPGRRTCRICRGKGSFQLPSARVATVCSCKGVPLPCPTCNGQGGTSRIALRFFHDEPMHVRDLLLPSHLPCYPPLFGLESAMEQVVDLGVDPPEELRCHDLTGRTAGSAYRGGERVVRPTFHGHDFGDTIDRALAAFKGFSAGSQILRYDIRAYAWPLLRVRYENPKDPTKPRDYALYVDRQGAIRLFGE